MSQKSCPISLVSVDSNIARINSFYVGILFSIYFISNFTFLIVFLIVDFFTRIFFAKEYSLIFILSTQTKKVLKLESINVDAAPKKLAAIFGLIFLIIILFLNILELLFAFYIFSAILFLCIFLELVFSYCVGCEIYHIYKKLFS